MYSHMMYQGELGRQGVQAHRPLIKYRGAHARGDSVKLP